MSIFQEPTTDRDFANLIVAMEMFLNDHLSMGRLEIEVVEQPRLGDRVHLRIITPDMEGKHDLPTKPRKAAVRSTSSQAAG